MELLLNLCWLGISIWAFAAWHADRRKRKRAYDSARVGTEGVALVCALILLFFPISITDDLHPEVFLTADSSFSRRDLPAFCAGKTIDHSPASPVLLLAPILPHRVFLPAVFVRFASELAAIIEFPSAMAAGSRAPPSPLA